MMFVFLFDAEAGAVTKISSSVFGANTMRISSIFVGICLSLSWFVLGHLCRFNCTEYSSHSRYNNNKYISKLCMYHLLLIYDK